MSHERLEPRNASPAELDARLSAERAGVAFVLYRDDQDRQRIFALDASASPVTIGRASAADICLSWDDRVSRVHARLELVGEDLAADWTVVDDGPSRNGSFVDGERVRGRARLRDGARLGFGGTAMLFSTATGDSRSTLVPGAARSGAGVPGPAGGDPETMTLLATSRLTRESLSDSQLRVLIALARPVRASRGSADPATDEEIAGETFLGIETVRRHIGALLARLGLLSLAADEQRAALVERALQSGVLAERDRDA